MPVIKHPYKLSQANPPHVSQGPWSDLGKEPFVTEDMYVNMIRGTPSTEPLPGRPSAIKCPRTLPE
jgi:hypothetical protein